MRLRIMALTIAVLAGTVGPVAVAGSAGASSTGPAEVHATVPVSIVDFAFQPNRVRIRVGDTVMWTNNGAVTHTVTGGYWNSGDIAPGGTYSRSFHTQGVFRYRCSIHPTQMLGAIRVVP
jgi:plastocyanin